MSLVAVVRAAAAVRTTKIVATDAGVFFEGVLNNNLPVPQVLTAHALERRVGCLEGIVGNKAKAFRLTRVFFPHYFRLFDESPKGPKGVVQQVLVDVDRVQVSHKQIGTNVLGPHFGFGIVNARLVHFQGSVVEFHHVENLNGVIGVPRV